MQLWQAVRHELEALDQGSAALRSFGRTVGAVLLVVAGVIYWRSGWVPTTAVQWFGGIGGVLVVLGVLAPAVLRPLYRVWMGLALVMGYVMTRVLLTVVFTLVVTPIGLLLRVIGKDVLHRKPDPEAKTYWLPKTYEADARTRLKRYY